MLLSFSRQTPLLGQLTSQGGNLFDDRVDHSRIDLAPKALTIDNACCTDSAEDADSSSQLSASYMAKRSLSDFSAKFNCSASRWSSLGPLLERRPAIRRPFQTRPQSCRADGALALQKPRIAAVHAIHPTSPRPKATKRIRRRRNVMVTSLSSPCRSSTDTNQRRRGWPLALERLLRAFPKCAINRSHFLRQMRYNAADEMAREGPF